MEEYKQILIKKIQELDDRNDIFAISRRNILMKLLAELE